MCFRIRTDFLRLEQERTRRHWGPSTPSKAAAAALKAMEEKKALLTLQLKTSEGQEGKTGEKHTL